MDSCLVMQTLQEVLQDKHQEVARAKWKGQAQKLGGLCRMRVCVEMECSEHSTNAHCEDVCERPCIK